MFIQFKAEETISRREGYGMIVKCFDVEPQTLGYSLQFVADKDLVIVLKTLGIEEIKRLTGLVEVPN